MSLSKTKKTPTELSQDIQRRIDILLRTLDPFDIPIAGKVNENSKIMDAVDELVDQMTKIQRAAGLATQYEKGNMAKK